MTAASFGDEATRASPEAIASQHAARAISDRLRARARQNHAASTHGAYVSENGPE